MKVLMLLQLLFFSKLMIDVCGHMCPLDWEINPPPTPHISNGLSVAVFCFKSD